MDSKPAIRQFRSWIAAMSLGLLAQVPGSLFAAGPQVYSCTDDKGHVTFSQTPCADDAESVDTRDALRTGTAPNRDELNKWLSDKADQKTRDQAHAANRAAAAAAFAAQAQPQPAPKPQGAWRCEASDGTVFYRHDGCPASVATAATFWLGGPADNFVHMQAPVTATRVARDEACDAIYAPRSGNRVGSSRDQRYSPYDRREGRDPCK